jgi:ribosomal protein S27E
MSKLRNHLRARLSAGCMSAADMLEELDQLEQEAMRARRWPMLAKLAPALELAGVARDSVRVPYTLEDMIAGARREIQTAWVRTEGDAASVSTVEHIGRAVHRLVRAMERIEALSPDDGACAVRCPVCTHEEVFSTTREAYGWRSAREGAAWRVTCPSCSTLLFVPEVEQRGRVFHPWPPALRIVRTT